MSAPSNIRFRSACDRLNLHGFDTGTAPAPLTLLCMGGLTRNSMDFTEFAQRLTRYRVLAVDQRGRGRSDWDPDVANYTPAVQAGDMLGLLDTLNINKAVLVGTSNGGLTALTMAAMQPQRVAGIILNDVGPMIPSPALAAINDLLADREPVRNWGEAARQVARINELALPTYGDADWDRFARRTYMEDDGGVPIPAYDPAITDALAAADLSKPLPDAWPVWDALGDLPVLAIRGAHSDLLPQDVLDEMVARHPRTTAAVVPDRGHCPMLDEPAAVAAVDRFLASIEPEG